MSTLLPPPSIAAHGGDDALLASAQRAFETLHHALDASRWSDDDGRVAHARTLVMIGRRELARAVLADGGVQSAILHMHLSWEDDDLEAAIAIGQAAIVRFPARAVGLRNSVASMLSALGRHDEALVLIADNRAAEPEHAVWRELYDLLEARRDDVEDDPLT